MKVFFLLAWVYEGTVKPGDKIGFSVLLTEKKLNRDPEDSMYLSKVIKKLSLSIEIEKIHKVFEIQSVDKGCSAGFKIKGSSKSAIVLKTNLIYSSFYNFMTKHIKEKQGRIIKKIICFESELSAEQYLQHLKNSQKDPT